jgi:hypothetical protein
MFLRTRDETKTHKYWVIAFVGYAIARFVGSATLGFLYDKSIASLIVVSVVLQLFALPVFLWARTQDKTVTD